MFELKKAGELGPGPAFTARLEVDYKAPIPASADVVCSARVESVEGRKVSLGRPPALPVARDIRSRVCVWLALTACLACGAAVLDGGGGQGSTRWHAVRSRSCAIRHAPQRGGGAAQAVTNLTDPSSTLLTGTLMHRLHAAHQAKPKLKCGGTGRRWRAVSTVSGPQRKGTVLFIRDRLESNRQRQHKLHSSLRASFQVLQCRRPA